MPAICQPYVIDCRGNRNINWISFIERCREIRAVSSSLYLIAPLQATSVIDYGGKLIRQRLAVIRMQRTDPISLRPVHRVNRKPADLVIVIVVTVHGLLVFTPSCSSCARFHLMYKRAGTVDIADVRDVFGRNTGAFRTSSRSEIISPLETDLWSVTTFRYGWKKRCIFSNVSTNTIYESGVAGKINRIASSLYTFRVSRKCKERRVSYLYSGVGEVTGVSFAF